MLTATVLPGGKGPTLVARAGPDCVEDDMTEPVPLSDAVGLGLTGTVYVEDDEDDVPLAPWRYLAPRKRVVYIVCDAESHAPKVATVRRLTVGKIVLIAGNVVERLLTDQAEHLIEDEVVPFADIFGTADTRITRWEPFRERWPLKCPLCRGPSPLALRHETALRLVQSLLADGESQIRLSELAARLRSLRAVAQPASPSLAPTAE